MPIPRPQPAGPFEELARTKLVRVLGEARAAQLYDWALAETGLSGLTTADELLAFSRVLSRLQGFEGALGSMLCVKAVMAGARDDG